MIANFKSRQLEEFWKSGINPKIPANLRRIALRKLKMIDDAQVLEDLRTPPGNRLETLSGDRAGQCSIRVNSQFRVCFRWQEGNAHDVEIVDYH